MSKNNDQIRELLAFYQNNGDRHALEQIMMEHMKLVCFIVNQFLSDKETYARTWFDDLCSEGNLGLMHAANEYDLSRNTKFSHYAYMKIFRNVSRAYHECIKQMKVPYSHVTRLKRYIEADSMFKNALNLEVSHREFIKSEMGISECQYWNLKHAAAASDVDFLDDDSFETSAITPTIRLEDEVIYGEFETFLNHILSQLDVEVGQLVVQRMNIDFSRKSQQKVLSRKEKQVLQPVQSLIGEWFNESN